MEQKRLFGEALLHHEFGPVVKQVGGVLFRYPSTLYTISKRTSLPTSLVRKAVLVLIQHDLAVVHPTSRRCIYTIDENAVVIRGALPIFALKAREHFGRTAEALFCTLAAHGKAKMSFLIQAANSRDTSLTEEDLVTSFRNLVKYRVIQRVKPANVAEDDFALHRFQMPAACASVRLTKQKTPKAADSLELKKSKLERDVFGDDSDNDADDIGHGTSPNSRGDAGIYWTIYYPTLLRLIMIQEVKTLCKSMFNDKAAAIIKALMMRDVADSALFSPAPANPHTILRAVVEDGVKGVDLSDIKQWAQVLASEFLNLVVATPDHQYYVDWKQAAAHMAQHRAEEIVGQKYGNKSLRILRLLFKKKFLDQDEVVRQALVENFGGTRLLLNELFQSGFAAYQDIPMTADRAPSRCIYLWHSSPAMVITKLIEESYQAMVTMHHRVEHERKTNAAILSRRKIINKAVETEERNSETDLIASSTMERARAEKDKLENIDHIIAKMQKSSILVMSQLLTLQLSDTTAICPGTST